MSGHEIVTTQGGQRGHEEQATNTPERRAARLVDGAGQGLGQRRAEAHAARGGAPLGDQRTWARPARGGDQAGVLLRHTRPHIERARARRPGAPRPAEGRRHGREAAARGARRHAGRHPRVNCLLGRGGRDARWLRLLGVDEGGSPQGIRAGRRGRGTAAPEAVLEGAASVLRRARAGRDRTGRPHDARTDLRAQAALLSEGVPTQDGRGDVALPGRLPGPRAVDQVHAVGGVPGRGGGEGIPRGARRERGGRAGDEDDGRRSSSTRLPSRPREIGRRRRGRERPHQGPRRARRHARARSRCARALVRGEQCHLRRGARRGEELLPAHSRGRGVGDVLGAHQPVRLSAGRRR